MFDRITLRRDLVDCHGHVLARQGAVISIESIAEAAAAARPGPLHSLATTFVADDLNPPLDEHGYRHLFRSPEVRAQVVRVLLSVRLPQALYDELLAMKAADPIRYRHAVATAAVATRMLTVAVSESRLVPEIAAAALLHDMGMRHLPARLVRGPEPLQGRETVEVAEHPLLGAWHLARILGPHTAVDAALCHHWRNGQGYPDLGRRPSRTLEVVAVASAFAALTQERSYRSDPFDTRSAADVLIHEAATERMDASAVKLLVHALRGGGGEAGPLRFAKARYSSGPTVNHHTAIAAPARSFI
ncbi:MAG TPA: HD domain-containing phosphohydrolase [Anaeromyxobacteraceae bacterium]|nr:HD domain-containing phosphohydrolase [Anaeromyxobacteraceae bacterium]